MEDRQQEGGDDLPADQAHARSPEGPAQPQVAVTDPEAAQQQSGPEAAAPGPGPSEAARQRLGGPEPALQRPMSDGALLRPPHARSSLSTRTASRDQLSRDQLSRDQSPAASERTALLDRSRSNSAVGTLLIPLLY